MKILLIGPYGIGNTILTLPAMKTVRNLFPDDRIDQLTLLRPVYDMVSRIPDFKIFNNIYLIEFNKSKYNAFKEIIKIRQTKYNNTIL